MASLLPDASWLLSRDLRDMAEGRLSRGIDGAAAGLVGRRCSFHQCRLKIAMMMRQLRPAYQHAD